MHCKLICIDIDGTLLNDAKEVLPAVKEAVKRQYEKGRKIALVSGRMPCAVTLVEKQLEMDCIKVCNAGTFIIVDGLCVKEEILSTHTMKQLYTDIARKHHVPLWVYQGYKWYVTETFNVARSSGNYLEIFSKSVDKGKAVAALCDIIKISTENVVAIGDHELDIPMIETAGIGIAMGNAIQGLKEKADFVTLTNNEAGVALALDEYCGF